MQDYLGLGNDCRMNQPSTVGENWRWRLRPGQLTREAAALARELTMRYGRMNWANAQEG